MKFREFHVGQVIEAGPYKVTEDAIIEFARRWDPQWFHLYPEAAKGGHFGGLIASGIQSLAIVMHLLVPAVLEGSESLASPGLAYVKWPNPTRVGDRLRLRVTLLEVRTSKKRPELGIVRWRWQLFNQGGDEVLEAEATSLFDLARGVPDLAGLREAYGQRTPAPTDGERMRP